MVQIFLSQLMRRVMVLSALLVLLGADLASAQDAQFSQFYAAPLYLNPAFAGSTNQGRVGMNYRNQWPGIDANFTTNLRLRRLLSRRTIKVVWA
ncbi:MAG: type IX secretion system membrane protein PorP/SprF [Bacteroidota bacterium]